MKSIIIFYSYGGNTKKVTEILAGFLKQKGEVELLELKARDESDKFLGQCKRAFWHKKAEIEPVDLDFTQYDLVCFGTPVWAFGPAPAMNACLDKCFGLGDKEIILFTTFGSGTGNGRCLNYMQDVLAGKGAKSFKKFSIQQFKVKNKEFVQSEVNKIGVTP